MSETLSSIRPEENTADKPLTGLDRSGSLYANRVQDMSSSSTRDLMSTLSRPGMISLASGFSDTKTFGEEAFQDICGAIAFESAQALQYGPTAELESVR
jgi:2-aminoadipate transaminase